MLTVLKLEVPEEDHLGVFTMQFYTSNIKTSYRRSVI